ncbi:ribonuclease H-like domain-containing protein [Petrocella sp. FN5]|uniref:ribonuclease H-like domain-containing protein n=1 Tax=Petrocella sp. FN5 TaxID=3032002 RepID=UPI0023D9F5F2|nr:ribonuclease H-like domain-containing protein [Petrocella sp. FN5]MDF1617538.1 ribonuclease H-like domain-containing protein [Petrocella sp. FN5]
MLVIKDIINTSEYEPNHCLFEPDTMAFDIETTGFSPKYATIYLIGMVYYDKMKNALIREQWFCEKASDEYELLFNFNAQLKKYNRIYHFNGDQFDLPFIKRRMALYKMDCPSYISYDLLKILRPFKKTLGLDNLKLKTLEKYFGYNRHDPFSGGDLIQVYEAYLDTKDEPLLQTLLLHNYEDLLGLVGLISHMPLFNLLEQMKEDSIMISEIYGYEDEGDYVISFPISEPVNQSFQLTHYQLGIHHPLCTLRIPLRRDTLKYYFPNPKDYFFLTTEGYAVHKSVGKYVDPSHKVQATKENCYIHKKGYFLPAYKHLNLPMNCYYENYTDVQGYVCLDDLASEVDLVLYAKKLLTLL